MTDTATVIANQLAENTGVAMCDSGGARGRMWQRNQDAAAAHGLTVPELFAAGQPVYWDGHMVIIDTYHWMLERLEFRADLQARFDRWINLGWIGLDRYERGPETNHPGTADAYIERMVERGWMEEHPEFTGWTNTYNCENLLSQDLQFRFAATTDDHPLGAVEIVFMSTHNGADARGGCSNLKIYECDPWECLDWDNFTAHCPACVSQPDPPDETLFDNAPYVARSWGNYEHRSGEWTDDQGSYLGRNEGPIIDPRWDDPDWEMPDDFVQTGPICRIHHVNMEVHAA
jgi:hypothetical protein